MFSAEFWEDNSADISIEGTSSAAFKALLNFLYMDNMETEDALLFDVAKLSDQYQVERLHNHCMHQLFTGVTVQNEVTRLVQAHTASGEGPMWANNLKSTTMSYVTRNFEEIRRNAMASLGFFFRKHLGLFKQMLLIRNELWPLVSTTSIA
jgi:hypothetical protein